MCTGESGIGRHGVVYHYYKCATAKKRKGGCHKKSVRKQEIENAVVCWLLRRIQSDEAVEAPVSSVMSLQESENTTIPVLEQHLRETEAGIRNMLNAIQQGVLTKSTKARLEELEAARDRLVFFDFRHHLYAPLICMKKGGLKIQVSPVSLNEDEKRFVDYLQIYVERKPALLEGKSLYLLRNKSRAGMGFFEAGNFYPDYILWIDDGTRQYITFIDPKGLLQVPVTDPKVEFYRKIKDVEARLAPTAGDRQIILNSFILSGTPSYEISKRWTMDPEKPADRAFCHARNVYTLDDPDCAQEMIEKILR